MEVAASEVASMADSFPATASNPATTAVNTAKAANTAAGSASCPLAGVGVGIGIGMTRTDMDTTHTGVTITTTTIPIITTRRLKATTTDSVKAAMTPPMAGLPIQTATAESDTPGTLYTATHTCEATPRATAFRLRATANHPN